LRGVVLTLLLALGSGAAQAQPWGGGPPGGPGQGGPPPGQRHPHWGGGPPPGEYGWWHSGRWWRGWHEGREGWWWIAGGLWHWYPEPVYPAPPPVFQPVPMTVPGVYYYCANPAGYYPQVGACLVPWQTVQAPPQ